MTNIEKQIRVIVAQEVERVLASNDNRASGANDYLTTKQVAEVTGLSKQYFEIGRSKGCPKKPPFIKIGTRVVYQRSDIDAWMQERKRGGVS